MLPGRHTGQSACFSDLCVTPGQTVGQRTSSEVCLYVCVPADTHLSKAALCPSVKSRETTNRRTAAPGFTDSTTYIFYSRTSHIKGILYHLFPLTTSLPSLLIPGV